MTTKMDVILTAFDAMRKIVGLVVDFPWPNKPVREVWDGVVRSVEHCIH